jgi:hypothetical protein
MDIFDFNEAETAIVIYAVWEMRRESAVDGDPWDELWDLGAGQMRYNALVLSKHANEVWKAAGERTDGVTWDWEFCEGIAGWAAEDWFRPYIDHMAYGKPVDWTEFHNRATAFLDGLIEKEEAQSAAWTADRTWLIEGFDGETIEAEIRSSRVSLHTAIKAWQDARERATWTRPLVNFVMHPETGDIVYRGDGWPTCARAIEMGEA